MAQERGKSGIEVGGVDPGALILAGAIAAYSFIAQPGDWTPLSLVVGLALTFVVIAYHHEAPNRGTPRHYLLRFAFGAVLGLTLGIALAYPIQQLVMVHLYDAAQDGDGNSLAGSNTTTAIDCLWPVLTIVFGLLEPRLTGLLDRRRPERVPAP